VLYQRDAVDTSRTEGEVDIDVKVTRSRHLPATRCRGALF